MSDFERESSVASFPSYEEDEEAVAADDIDDDGAGPADAHDYDRDSARMRVPMHAHHSCSHHAQMTRGKMARTRRLCV